MPAVASAARVPRRVPSRAGTHANRTVAAATAASAGSPHSSQAGRNSESKKILSDYPRGLRNTAFSGAFWLLTPLAVTPALPVALLFARRRRPLSLLRLPPRPLRAASGSSSLQYRWRACRGCKPPLASLQQTLPGPRTAHAALSPAVFACFPEACRILGRAHGRWLPEAQALEGNANPLRATMIFLQRKSILYLRRCVDFSRPAWRLCGCASKLIFLLQPVVSGLEIGAALDSGHDLFLGEIGHLTSAVMGQPPLLSIRGLVPTGPAKMAPSLAAVNRSIQFRERMKNKRIRELRMLVPRFKFRKVQDSSYSWDCYVGISDQGALSRFYCCRKDA